MLLFPACAEPLRDLTRRMIMGSEKPIRSLPEIGREELYNLIWTKPVVAVARDFGVSAAAVATHCRKHEVPRPSRGYWAKRDAGKSPRKKPLPPTKAEVFLKAAGKPARKALALPTQGTILHPIATELRALIHSGSITYDKRVHVRNASIPRVDVTKALAERAAAAFHVIIKHAESLDIPFRKSQSDYNGGFFRKGTDRLYLKIEEGLTEEAEINSGDHRHAAWHRPSDRKIPSGLLAFSLSTNSWEYGDAKRWREDKHLSLQKILAQIVTEICRHFAETHKRRIEEAIERERQHVEWQRRHQERLREEAVRQQQERTEKHAQLLASIKREREENFLKATESWHRCLRAEEFLAVCESRWRDAQANILTAEQGQWLQWAREINRGLSPFTAGYPDPSRDGAFDKEAVPLGGPYPETRKFLS